MPSGARIAQVERRQHAEPHQSRPATAARPAAAPAASPDSETAGVRPISALTSTAPGTPASHSTAGATRTPAAEPSRLAA